MTISKHLWITVGGVEGRSVSTKSSKGLHRHGCDNRSSACFSGSFADNWRQMTASSVQIRLLRNSLTHKDSLTDFHTHNFFLAFKCQSSFLSCCLFKHLVSSSRRETSWMHLVDGLGLLGRLCSSTPTRLVPPPYPPPSSPLCAAGQAEQLLACLHGGAVGCVQAS